MVIGRPFAFRLIVLPLSVFPAAPVVPLPVVFVRLQLPLAFCAVVVKFPFAIGSMNPPATVFTFAPLGLFAFHPEVFDMIDFDTRTSKYSFTAYGPYWTYMSPDFPRPPADHLSVIVSLYSAPPVIFRAFPLNTLMSVAEKRTFCVDHENA